MPTIICKICGRECERKSNGQKYCEECRLEEYRRRHRVSDAKQKEHKKEYFKRYNVDYYKKNKERFVCNDKTIIKVRRYTHQNFKKDNKCHFCGSNEGLVFHHLIYEYPPKREQIITLCGSCHNKLHYVLKINNISNKSKLQTQREEMLEQSSAQLTAVFKEIGEIQKFIFGCDATNRLCDISPSIDLMLEDIKRKHIKQGKK